MSKYNFYVEDVSVEAVFNKLGGVEGAKRFLSGYTHLVVPQFEIWKTIKVGVYKNLNTLQGALKKFKQGDYAKDILTKPEFLLWQIPENISLCRTTVEKLTGKNQPTTTDIFNTVRFVGDTVPAEVGPALRLQYLEQPKGECLYVAMEPIKDSTGELNVFRVECSEDGWLCLDTEVATPNTVWLGSELIVFNKRR